MYCNQVAPFRPVTFNKGVPITRAIVEAQVTLSCEWRGGQVYQGKDTKNMCALYTPHRSSLCYLFTLFLGGIFFPHLILIWDFDLKCIL